MIWTGLMCFSLFLTAGVSVKTKRCFIDVERKIRNDCSIAPLDKAISEVRHHVLPTKIFHFTKQSKLVEQLCEKFDTMIECQVNHLSACSVGKELMDFTGVSLTNARSAASAVCKQQKDLLDGLKCFLNPQRDLNNIVGCFKQYVYFIRTSLNLAYSSRLTEEMRRQSCVHYDEGVSCLLKEASDCPKFSRLLENFSFGVKTRRCKENIPVSGESIMSALKPAEYILLLILIFPVGLY